MLVDFWRLIWQERPPIIVMLTNIKEGNKVKCEQYWPDSGSKNYGPFKVTLVEYQMFADYVIRTLEVTVRKAIHIDSFCSHVHSLEYISLIYIKVRRKFCKLETEAVSLHILA